MKLSPQKNQKGFTLIEVTVSLAIIAVLILGVYSLVILSLRITADNKNYVSAIEIANQKMEQIRNMPYDNVGTIDSSIVSGTIPQIVTIERGGVFTVTTNVTMPNDPYDDIAGVDTIPNDYKQATVKVGWESSYGPKSISVFSKIVSKTKEVAAGYGLLELHSVDSNGLPVPNANVYIDNDILVPAMHEHTTVTDANGILNMALLKSFQGYKITVSKAGYSTDYSLDPASGLTPIHLSITEGNKTAESFSIDKLATLIVKTYSDNIPANWMVNKATSTSSKSKTAISKDDSGNIYFIWQDVVDATNAGVFIQKYNSAKTRQWLNDVRVETSSNETNPSIATSKNGTSYVVWQDSSIALKSLAKAPVESSLASNDDLTSPSSDKVLNVNKIVKSSLLRPLSNVGRLAELYFNKIKVFLFHDIRNNSHIFVAKIKKYFSNNSAVAAGTVTIVQTKIGANVNNSPTLSATFDSAPLSGNVIIAIASHRHSFTSFITPAGFTKSVYSDVSASLDAGIWHKVAGASESKTVSITNSGDINGGVLMLMEVSGLETASLLDVVSMNYQGDLSKTGNTDLTATSTNNSFGVAAVSFGDDAFTAPTSANWQSSSSNVYTQKMWDDWNSGSKGSLSVATININAGVPQKATLGPLLGGSNTYRNSVLAIFKIKNDTSVSAINSQTASITFPATNQYIGGSFAITASSTNSVSSIKISEDGTVDAQNNLENIHLYYDIDSSFPYDCVSESYAGTDLQFGTNTGFDSYDGVAIFTKVGGVTIDTTHSLCVYTVLDVKSSSNKNDTVEIKISNPATDVIISAGLMTPGSTVAIAGTTILLKPAELQQIHYRFRNDDGDESTASWSKTEDNNLITKIGAPVRLRFAVTNAGSFDSAATSYQIQYGEKDTTCAAISVWSSLPAKWKMYNSSNINDGDATTDSTGITNENTNFKASQIKDTGSQTSALTLTSSDFTEIEYSLEADGSASEKTYCFRLTNAGATTQFNYIEYPEISIVGDDNIYIKSFNNDGSEHWGVKRVHLDSSSVNQQNPQIAITENFGTATTTVIWEDSRNGNIDIYAQSFNEGGNRLWSSDLRITSSSTNEINPVIDIDAEDNIYISWEEQGDIYLQKFDIDGNKLWLEPINITNSGVADFRPRISHASTTALLSWTASESSIYNTYLAKFDSTGSLIWKERANVESSEKNQFYPTIASNDSNVYVTWTDDRNGNNNIYAQKFNLSGVAEWTNDQKITDDIDSSDQNSPAIIISSDNKIFSAWHDERSLSKEIYATEISEPGTPTVVANVPLVITGSRLIYKDPLQYKYSQTHATDGGGDLSLQLEWDASYQIVASSTLTGLIVTECRPLNCPISISADEIKTIEIYVK
ncbi:prepilin-type N-terminal cleavage/methylation domain-containing protein [Candidatus Parcubacteria bacterium]|nr:prepilin-type N-terminal cleavage/methylation domain-containing protein [Patescibacteria group bacterium]MBU4309065.1 prepilin-type N-terminal cleavage/methylation domain-containing protein [Patescibacteria group bacterium]MBU4432442.1 prepilin-type N-terminal cleavage/methylation domain-containing protein [Patescibacteria group bacterium]MBU4577426.1 prepilin-type N-terminal cleavage/methylation domain-containing protein [Patescibacteria group bacterium]MCG2697114.1 prepilin-type N-terminal